MQNSYANEKVLRFYQNLQFNIYSKPKLSAEQIKKNNPIDIYKNLEKFSNYEDLYEVEKKTFRYQQRIF